MRPFPGWPVFDDEQIAAAQAVLASGRVNYWTGTEGRAFEDEYAAALGVKHAIAVSNGTVALELALAAAGIGPGDDVLVPCRTFIATASSVVARGARPIVADVDETSQNVTAATLARALTSRTRAVIVVHLAGWPCEMDEILEFSSRHELTVIEDCAQAHGARYRGRPAGAWGHLSAFSFCQDKILTTGGEGGLIATDDTELFERAWSYKDHGKSLAACRETHTGHVFRYLHESFGTNGRLTEMQAAIGRVALRRLPEWVAGRRRHAERLAAAFQDVPALTVPGPEAHIEHSYYKFYAFVDAQALGPGWTRDRVVNALQAEGIPCGSGICPDISREQAFAGAGFVPAAARPAAGRLGNRSLMFQVHPTLTDEDIDDVARAVRKVMQAASFAAPVRGAKAA